MPLAWSQKEKKTQKQQQQQQQQQSKDQPRESSYKRMNPFFVTIREKYGNKNNDTKVPDSAV